MSKYNKHGMRGKMDPDATEPLSIAIIGTGIAGETAAYLLTHHSHHDVAAIYEASSCPGLHANSVELNNHSVDVPLRAVSPHYYPNLTSLYRHLSIPLQSVDYSSCGSYFNPNETYFRHNNVILGGLAFPFPHWKDLQSPTVMMRHMRIIRDVLWLVFTGPFLLRHHKLYLRRKSLGAYLREYNYSYEFIHLFLYPAMSTLLSCSLAQVEAYPADYIIGFYCSRITTIFTGWYRVQAGVQVVSNKLLEGVPTQRQHYNCRVQSVRSTKIGKRQAVIITDHNGNERTFDRVIIATEPSVAKAIWADVSPNGDAAVLMDSVRTYRAEITLHSDPSLMPASAADWKGLNYFTPHQNVLGQVSTEAASNGESSPHSSSTARRSVTPKKGGRASSSGSKASKKAVAAKSKSTTVTTAGHHIHQASMTTAYLNLYYPNELGSPAMGKRSNNIFESWNSFRPPQNGLLIRNVSMVRSVWDVSGRDTFEKLLPTIQGRDGVYVAGSYVVPGITLLEQAVTSACHVCLQLGGEVPFKVRPAYEATWWTTIVAYILFGITCSWRFAIMMVLVGVPAFFLCHYGGKV